MAPFATFVNFCVCDPVVFYAILADMEFYRRLNIGMEDEETARRVGKDLYSIATDDGADTEVRKSSCFDIMCDFACKQYRAVHI